MNEQQKAMYDGVNADADELGRLAKQYEEISEHLSNRYYTAASTIRRAALVYKEGCNEGAT